VEDEASYATRPRIQTEAYKIGEKGAGYTQKRKLGNRSSGKGRKVGSWPGRGDNILSHHKTG